MDGRGDKLQYFDGLRGLAVLAVLLCHFALAFFPFLYYGPGQVVHFEIERFIYNSPLNLLMAGEFAVCLFFVMSAFVLSYRFFAKGDNNAPASGAVRRYFRLMPAVLVSSLLAWALMHFGLLRNVPVAGITGSNLWLVQSWGGVPDFLEAVKFGLYDAFFTGDNVMKYNNVLWTMKIELFGSLLVFALLALFGRMTRRWIIYAVAAVLLFNTYYLAFIVGVALCDLVVASRNRRLALGSALIGWMAIAQGLSIGALNVLHPFHETYRVFMYVVGASLVIAGVLLVPAARRMLAVKPLLYVGRLSFAVYLLHLVVMGSVGCGLFLRIYPVLGYKAAFVIGFGVSVIVTFALAELLTRYVDVPATRFSGVIYRRLVAPRQTATPATATAPLPDARPEQVPGPVRPSPVRPRPAKAPPTPPSGPV